MLGVDFCLFESSRKNTGMSTRNSAWAALTSGWGVACPAVAAVCSWVAVAAVAAVCSWVAVAVCSWAWISVVAAVAAVAAVVVVYQSVAPEWV